MTGTARPPLPDREAVRAAALRALPAIARRAWPGERVIRRTATTLRYGARGARVVHLTGRLAGRYADWEAGHHGDVFDLWARAVLGLAEARADFPAVLRDLAAFLGVTETTPARPRLAGPGVTTRTSSIPGNPAPSSKDRADRFAIAAMIGASEPLPGSPATRYLRARAIHRTVGAEDLRFVAANRLDPLDGLYRGTGARAPAWLDCPAILCLARDAAGTVFGVQRILLDRTCRRQAATPVRKPATGRLAGAALHLPARADAMAIPGQAPPVLLAEGPETALSLWQATGLETRAALGGLASGRPPDDRARLHLLCRDADPPGSAADTATARVLARWRAEGVAVQVVAPPGAGDPGADFNDTARHRGDGAIRSAILAALMHATPI